MQQNYDKRQGISVFKSKTVRSTFTDTCKKMTSPPPGLYEPKFIKGHEDNNCMADKSKKEESKIDDPLTPRLINPNSKQVDLRYIHKSYNREPTTQHFSCFADTRKVDFSNGQTRDDVSFYRDLARISRAKELNIDLDEYIRLLRMAKTGKVTVLYNSIDDKKKGKQSKFKVPKKSRNDTEGKQNTNSIFGKTDQSLNTRKQTIM